MAFPLSKITLYIIKINSHSQSCCVFRIRYLTKLSITEMKMQLFSNVLLNSPYTAVF